MRARAFLADLRDNARDLFNRAITARDVRALLAGQQQVPTAEQVESRVAALFILAVEEPSLLLAVQWDVGVVEIQHDLARCALMRFEEEIHQQCIDLRVVTIDLVILRRMQPRRVLQAIERALASQRFAVGPQHRAQLPRQHPKRRVLAELIVIVEVFITQRWVDDALPHQLFDIARSRRSMKQSAKRRTSPRPRSACPNSSAPSAYTLSASGSSLDSGEITVAQRFSQIRSPDAPPAFEKFGLAVAQAR